MNHTIANRMTLLSRQQQATVVVVCVCGDKFRATNTRDAERKQFNHMVEKERGQ